MRKLALIALIIITSFCFYACKSNSLGAINSFQVKDTLSAVNSIPVKIILLYGQSNATGLAGNDYLKEKAPDTYAKAEEGYQNVLINLFTENGGNSSNGEFVPVTLGQGASKDYFGPELGLADALSERFAQEKVFAIKYSWGGSILNSQWLNGKYERGELYNAAISFTKTSLEYLKSKGYIPEIAAVCWMQGESDAIEKRVAKRYLKNTRNFVGFLGEDLKDYCSNPLFIDAGVAEIEVWKHYEIVNGAKKQVAEESDLNVYFSTAEMGLTTDKEPEGNADIAHFDSLSAFALGRKFASYID